MELSSAIDAVANDPKVSPDKRLASLETLLKIVQNILQHPEEEKFRRLKMTTTAFQNNVAKINGGVSC